MRKFQKKLAAVVLVVLLYSAVTLMFVACQRGLVNKMFPWQVNVFSIFLLRHCTIAPLHHCHCIVRLDRDGLFSLLDLAVC